MASISLSSSTSRSEDSDAWDDDLLIKEYDKVTRQVNKTVNERLKTNSSGLAVKTFLPKKPKDVCTTFENGDKTAADTATAKVWQLGEYCRAVYEEDSLEYEAQIVDVQNDTCTVRYVGYENEEQQVIANLLPSKGKAARKAQQKEAQVAAATLAASAAVMAPAGAEKKRDDTHLPHSPKKEHTSSQIHQQFIPPPPSFFPQIPSQEDDSLASMLMSWYMAGYHTGYYQALRHNQSSFNH